MVYIWFWRWILLDGYRSSLWIDSTQNWLWSLKTFGNKLKLALPFLPLLIHHETRIYNYSDTSEYGLRMIVSCHDVIYMYDRTNQSILKSNDINKCPPLINLKTEKNIRQKKTFYTIHLIMFILTNNLTKAKITCYIAWSKLILYGKKTKQDF